MIVSLCLHDFYRVVLDGAYFSPLSLYLPRALQLVGDGLFEVCLTGSFIDCGSSLSRVVPPLD